VTKSPSQLPTAADVTDDDVLVGNDGATTKQFPATTLKAYAGGATVGGDLTGTVANAQIAAGAVGTTELADGAVTGSKIASTTAITAGSVTLTDGSVQVQLAPTGGLRSYTAHAGSPGNYDGHLRLYGGASTIDAPLLWTTAGSDLHVNDLRHDNPAGYLNFFGAGPVQRQPATTDLKDALTAYGLLQGTSASPLDLDGGALTAGKALLADGTVAEPALAFTAEPGAGLRRSAASQVDMVLAGAMTHRFYANGSFEMHGTAAGQLWIKSTQAGMLLSRPDGTNDWQVYRSGTAASSLFITDRINNRHQVIVSAGATAQAALTTFDSAVKVIGNVGFYGATPVAKQTGVAVTAAGVHAALVNLGLIAA